MIAELLSGLAVADVAARCRVTPAHVRHWRAGRRWIPLVDLETILDMRQADTATRERATSWWKDAERARHQRPAPEAAAS